MTLRRRLGLTLIPLGFLAGTLGLLYALAPEHVAQLPGYMAFAFVVARDGAESGLETALARAVEDRLAPHQRPRRVFVVPELPRTATGKVQRFVLRDWVADRDR